MARYPSQSLNLLNNGDALLSCALCKSLHGRQKKMRGEKMYHGAHTEFMRFFHINEESRLISFTLKVSGFHTKENIIT